MRFNSLAAVNLGIHVLKAGQNNTIGIANGAEASSFVVVFTGTNALGTVISAFASFASSPVSLNETYHLNVQLSPLVGGQVLVQIARSPRTQLPQWGTAMDTQDPTTLAFEWSGANSPADTPQYGAAISPGSFIVNWAVLGTTP